ncbi:MAG TPA: YetF domain-containing protein [Longimicrobiaceae bacterium]|nr:YetF domain-containing protein [Longimicrobiaceae bacterium]
MRIEFWPESWANVLLPHAPIAELVVRATFVYFFLLILLRTLGRHEMGRLSIADLLVMVLLATSQRQALVGANATGVGDGLIIALILMSWDWAIRWLVFHFPRMRQLFRPRPVQLIRDGRLLTDPMHAQGLTMEQVESQLRLSGIDSVEQVEKAWLESEGQISAIPYKHRRRERTEAAARKGKGEAAKRDEQHS